ncbi:antigen identified by monoclonal antibody Ki-67 [Dinochytrium kinnereticum]|nr:antigen identified by monoclonal antibody Ki-67 [Dinochytrium kinnereticum]
MATFGRIIVIRRTGEDGKALSCTIRVRLPEVSRNHCIISVKEDNIIYLTDLSNNGTLLNGSEIPRNEPVALSNGDVFSVLTRTFRFEYSDTPPGKLLAAALPGNPGIDGHMEPLMHAKSMSGVEAITPKKRPNCIPDDQLSKPQDACTRTVVEKEAEEEGEKVELHANSCEMDLKNDDIQPVERVEVDTSEKKRRKLEFLSKTSPRKKKERGSDSAFWTPLASRDRTITSGANSPFKPLTVLVAGAVENDTSRQDEAEIAENAAQERVILESDPDISLISNAVEALDKVSENRNDTTDATIVLTNKALTHDGNIVEKAIHEEELLSPAKEQGVTESRTPIELQSPVLGRKTVTFAPPLSPEIFAKDQPPSTPIKRGAALPMTSTPTGLIRSALRKGRSSHSTTATKNNSPATKNVGGAPMTPLGLSVPLDLLRQVKKPTSMHTNSPKNSLTQVLMNSLKSKSVERVQNFYCSSAANSPVRLPSQLPRPKNAPYSGTLSFLAKMKKEATSLPQTSTKGEEESLSVKTSDQPIALQKDEDLGMAVVDTSLDLTALDNNELAIIDTSLDLVSLDNTERSIRLSGLGLQEGFDAGPTNPSPAHEKKIIGAVETEPIGADLIRFSPSPKKASITESSSTRDMSKVPNPSGIEVMDSKNQHPKLNSIVLEDSVENSIEAFKGDGADSPHKQSRTIEEVGPIRRTSSRRASLPVITKTPTKRLRARRHTEFKDIDVPVSVAGSVVVKPTLGNVLESASAERVTETSNLVASESVAHEDISLAAEEAEATEIEDGAVSSNATCLVPAFNVGDAADLEGADKCKGASAISSDPLNYGESLHDIDTKITANPDENALEDVNALDGEETVDSPEADQADSDMNMISTVPPEAIDAAGSPTITDSKAAIDIVNTVDKVLPNDSNNSLTNADELESTSSSLPKAFADEQQPDVQATAVMVMLSCESSVIQDDTEVEALDTHQRETNRINDESTPESLERQATPLSETKKSATKSGRKSSIYKKATIERPATRSRSRQSTASSPRSPPPNTSETSLRLPENQLSAPDPVPSQTQWNSSNSPFRPSASSGDDSDVPLSERRRRRRTRLSDVTSGLCLKHSDISPVEALAFVAPIEANPIGLNCEDGTPKRMSLAVDKAFDSSEKANEDDKENRVDVEVVAKTDDSGGEMEEESAIDKVLDMPVKRIDLDKVIEQIGDEDIDLSDVEEQIPVTAAHDTIAVPNEGESTTIPAADEPPALPVHEQPTALPSEEESITLFTTEGPPTLPAHEEPDTLANEMEPATLIAEEDAFSALKQSATPSIQEEPTAPAPRSTQPSPASKPRRGVRKGKAKSTIESPPQDPIPETVESVEQAVDHVESEAAMEGTPVPPDPAADVFAEAEPKLGRGERKGRGVSTGIEDPVPPTTELSSTIDDGAPAQPSEREVETPLVETEGQTGKLRRGGRRGIAETHASAKEEVATTMEGVEEASLETGLEVEEVTGFMELEEDSGKLRRGGRRLKGGAVLKEIVAVKTRRGGKRPKIVIEKEAAELSEETLVALPVEEADASSTAGNEAIVEETMPYTVVHEAPKPQRGGRTAQPAIEESPAPIEEVSVPLATEATLSTALSALTEDETPQADEVLEETLVLHEEQKPRRNGRKTKAADEVANEAPVTSVSVIPRDETPMADDVPEPIVDAPKPRRGGRRAKGVVEIAEEIPATSAMQESHDSTTRQVTDDETPMVKEPVPVAHEAPKLRRGARKAKGVVAEEVSVTVVDTPTAASLLTTPSVMTEGKTSTVEAPTVPDVPKSRRGGRRAKLTVEEAPKHVEETSVIDAPVSTATGPILEDETPTVQTLPEPVTEPPQSRRSGRKAKPAANESSTHIEETGVREPPLPTPTSTMLEDETPIEEDAPVIEAPKPRRGGRKAKGATIDEVAEPVKDTSVPEAALSTAVSSMTEDDIPNVETLTEPVVEAPKPRRGGRKAKGVAVDEVAEPVKDELVPEAALSTAVSSMTEDEIPTAPKPRRGGRKAKGLVVDEVAEPVKDAPVPEAAPSTAVSSMTEDNILNVEILPETVAEAPKPLRGRRKAKGVVSEESAQPSEETHTPPAAVSTSTSATAEAETLIAEAVSDDVPKPRRGGRKTKLPAAVEPLNDTLEKAAEPLPNRAAVAAEPVDILAPTMETRPRRGGRKNQIEGVDAEESVTTVAGDDNTTTTAGVDTTDTVKLRRGGRGKTKLAALEEATEVSAVGEMSGKDELEEMAKMALTVQAMKFISAFEGKGSASGGGGKTKRGGRRRVDDEEGTEDARGGKKVKGEDVVKVSVEVPVEMQRGGGGGRKGKRKAGVDVPTTTTTTTILPSSTEEESTVRPDSTPTTPGLQSSPAMDHPKKLRPIRLNLTPIRLKLVHHGRGKEGEGRREVLIVGVPGGGEEKRAKKGKKGVEEGEEGEGGEHVKRGKRARRL